MQKFDIWVILFTTGSRHGGSLLRSCCLSYLRCSHGEKANEEWAIVPCLFFQVFFDTAANLQFAPRLFFLRFLLLYVKWWWQISRWRTAQAMFPFPVDRWDKFGMLLQVFLHEREWWYSWHLVRITVRRTPSLSFWLKCICVRDNLPVFAIRDQWSMIRTNDVFHDIFSLCNTNLWQPSHVVSVYFLLHPSSLNKTDLTVSSTQKITVLSSTRSKSEQ